MKKEVIVLIAEDDDGHAALIAKNLKRAGLLNEIIRFSDGQETLDFLFEKGNGKRRKPDTAYMLLLDIRMPKVDGLDVLRQVKADKDLKKLPIIMLTTTDDPREVALCHELGCSNYITKPIDYDKFMEAVRQLGLFLLVVEVPKIDGNGKK
jgi:CheY-like chemotaxis protein